MIKEGAGMLYFREREKKKLQDFLAGTGRAMAIYGRRRTGKTELILDHLANNANRDVAYYQCASFDYSTCLRDLTAVLEAYLPGDMIIRSLTSFKDVFTYISSRQTGLRAIVIDEFPFLAKKNENVPVEFQWIIDHGLDGLKLILLGSNLSFMKKQIDDSESPLYGRFDEIIEILPFRFNEVRSLFPKFSEAVDVYAQTGGVAQYVMMYRSCKTVEAATRSLYFDKNGRLFQEAGNLLMQELRDVTVYTRILRAIGGREKTSGQIAAACALDQRGVFAYLNKLIDLDIVAASENPLSAKKSEKRYKIKDNLFRFSYTFIEPSISMITAIGEKSAEYILDTSYSEYLGFVYEEIIKENCFDYAVKGIIPFMPETVSKWWGNIKDGNEWKESEVDLIAYNNNKIVVGECKYRNKAAGIKELDSLKKKAAFIPVKNREIYYLIASKSGFTDELAERKDVILIKEA